jgi:N-acetylglucosamine-6-phosphate deacetylase
MNFTAFTNARIFTGESEIAGKTLLIEDDLISGIIDNDAIPENAKVINCQNYLIAPGLIDLQIYGAGGYLFSQETTSAALTSIIHGIIKSGTTGFLLTLATNSMEVYRNAIRVVKENPHPALLGLHLEGPYINPVKRGAHISEFIKRPEKEELVALLKEGSGVIKMITLAPEMVDPEIIDLLKKEGVVISAGHSNATFQEANDSFANGITTVTHLFNAMTALHHRETGLPGASMLSGDVYASIIADGIHVDYNTLRLSKKLMNDKLFLITDAVEAVDKGAYVHVRQADRFTLPDGTLSGSCLTQLRAVQNCVEHVGISLAEALRMASTYPARVMNSDETGMIQPGYKANLTIFSEDFQPQFTVVHGKILDRDS